MLEEIKQEIIKTITELEENKKYHANFIQNNTDFIIFGLQMTLDIIANKENKND